MSTIPASQIVNVPPNVIAAGGNALDLNGLALSTSIRVPIGTVRSFPDVASVSAYFGAAAQETSIATVYFNGFDNSNAKPGAILFAQYPTAAVSAYLRGGNIGAALTLAQLQALTPGTLTIVTQAGSLTSASINLSGATSFSNAAALIQAAFTSPSFSVTYDAFGSFLITTTATGATATLVFATGAMSSLLMLTSATGAVLSQGAAIAVAGTFMTALVRINQNWATFMTAFDMDGSTKILFCAWVNGQNNRYAYVCWDTEITATTTVPATASIGYIVNSLGYSGSFIIYEATDLNLAAFVCGAIASIDFEETNGRATLAFRRQAGLMPSVTDGTVAANLLLNHYNFYGAYATANDQFVWLYDGKVSGTFIWMDSYINQIWLNNAFQLALMTLLGASKSIPYNSAGYALIEAALADPINAGLNFGAFRAGVTLSAAQIAEVNADAGADIADTLQTRGWYLQILDASATVRAARGSPPCTFWYMDGESVQKINLTSVNVQ